MTKYLKWTTTLLIFVILFSSCEKEDENENNNTFKETEQNGTFATANEIVLGETYDAKIDPIMDEDYFKVTSSGDVNITVAGEGSLEVRVHCFDQDQIDFFGDDAGERGGTLTKNVSSGDYEGFFYIRVESAYGNDIGDYTIKVE